MDNKFLTIVEFGENTFVFNPIVMLPYSDETGNIFLIESVMHFFRENIRKRPSIGNDDDDEDALQLPMPIKDSGPEKTFERHERSPKGNENVCYFVLISIQSN